MLIAWAVLCDILSVCWFLVLWINRLDRNIGFLAGPWQVKKSGWTSCSIGSLLVIEKHMNP
jgi:hypothetical protein